MKKTFILLGLLLIAVCVFAQAPDWQWATQAGGSTNDVGKAITIDNAGNSYVTGNFKDTATFGSYSLSSSGDYDIFIAKMDANGNWLWATQAGGSNEDAGMAITIDDVGNTYVTGYFVGTASFGSYSLISYGGSDIFVAKINVTGNWQWATKAGGTSHDDGEAITIDNAGNCYVTGDFQGTATFGSYSLTSSGEKDIFIAKMDTDGNWLWASKADGSSYDGGYGITIDDAGNTYVTGYFMGTANFGSNSLTSSGQTDIFVAKTDTDGNWLWATKAGGISCDRASEIAIDDAGNTYVTGDFEDTATFGSYSLTSNGCEDIFVAKMDADGNWLWATKAGGSVYDRGYGITIDDAGNTYVTGLFEGEATFGSYSLTSNEYLDIFVAKMDVYGSWLWVTQAGGISDDVGKSITIDDAGNIYVTGYFWDTATFGSYILTSSGDSDIFVAKLNSTLSVENEIIPTEIRLSNYPNPFNPATKIHYAIKEKSNVRIDVCNIKGQMVKSIINGQQDAGDYSVIWNGKDDNGNKVSSGIYFYKLNVNGEEKAVSKCVLLK